MPEPTSFKDHFSGHAGEYASYRPRYPARLAEVLASHTAAHRVAVDCGCGNGQLSPLLAEHFDLVHALDPSAEQVAHAIPHPRVQYRVARAEATGLPDHVADLVVAAQAVHWFDQAAYWREVRRIAAPGALCAIVGYAVMRCDAAIDACVQRFHDVALAPFWPPERMSVIRGYRDVDFPFDEVSVPAVDITAEWTLDQMIPYLGTWSAVKRAEQAGQGHLFREVGEELGRLWGDPATARPVRWPVVVRMGRVSG